MRLSRAENLIGRKFGKLVVLERGENIGSGTNSKARWVCLCVCGNRTLSTTANLKNGTSKSCGCYKKERIQKTQIVDMVGVKSGMLTVVSFHHTELNNGKNTSGAYWLCICGCGNKCIVSGKRIRRKNTTSCGCRTESSIASETKQYFYDNYSAILEYKILKSPHTGRWLPYDIYIPNDTYVEINGSQHYEFVPYWHKTKENFERNLKISKLKRRFAENNGTYIEIDLREIKNSEDAIKYIEGKL